MSSAASKRKRADGQPAQKPGPKPKVQKVLKSWPTIKFKDLPKHEGEEIDVPGAWWDGCSAEDKDKLFLCLCSWEGAVCRVSNLL
jgi:hypothetical protein